jgi:hypothetical protein
VLTDTKRGLLTTARSAGCYTSRALRILFQLVQKKTLPQDHYQYHSNKKKISPHGTQLGDKMRVGSEMLKVTLKLYLVCKGI